MIKVEVVSEIEFADPSVYINVSGKRFKFIDKGEVIELYVKADPMLAALINECMKHFEALKVFEEEFITFVFDKHHIAKFEEIADNFKCDEVRYLPEPFKGKIREISYVGLFSRKNEEVFICDADNNSLNRYLIEEYVKGFSNFYATYSYHIESDDDHIYITLNDELGDAKNNFLKYIHAHPLITI